MTGMMKPLAMTFGGWRWNTLRGRNILTVRADDHHRIVVDTRHRPLFGRPHVTEDPLGR